MYENSPLADSTKPEDQAQPATSPTQQTPDLGKLLEQTNIAENLDDELLTKIGDEVYEGYQRDLASKSEWDRSVDEWVKLAAQVKDEKSYPWPKASNVKYPLLATAAMQFAARAYPALVPSGWQNSTVQGSGTGPTGAQSRQSRQARYAHELPASGRYGRLGRGNGPSLDSTPNHRVHVQEDTSSIRFEKRIFHGWLGQKTWS
jgi:hypothetical protein